MLTTKVRWGLVLEVGGVANPIILDSQVISSVSKRSCMQRIELFCSFQIGDPAAAM